MCYNISIFTERKLQPMATAVLKSIGVTLALNNGVSPTGSVKTVNVKLGGTNQNINATTYNTDLSTNRTKALALATAIEMILTKSIYEVDETTVNKLSN